MSAFTLVLKCLLVYVLLQFYRACCEVMGERGGPKKVETSFVLALLGCEAAIILWFAWWAAL